MTPRIRFMLRQYAGYGTPPSWEVRAVYDNHLLEEILCSSEYEQGQAAAELKTRWEKEWNEDKFRQIINSKPLASPWCDVCGKDTLDGCISCVEKTFCKGCEPLIPQYKEEFRKQQAKVLSEITERNDRMRLERNKETNDAITGAFHWQKNWFWKRLPNGDVRLMRLESHKSQTIHEYLDPDLTIPADEWASIVSSVSASGETAETWQAIRDFHAAGPRPSAPAPSGEPLCKCGHHKAYICHAKNPEVALASNCCCGEYEPAESSPIPSGEPTQFPEIVEVAKQRLSAMVGDGALLAQISRVEAAFKKFRESSPVDLKDAARKSGIYVASKTRHAAMWRKYRETYPIISTWIDEAEVGQTKSFEDLWIRCIREATHAERVILFVETGDELKGALIEAGAAIGAGVPVFVLGDVPQLKTATNHPLVIPWFTTIEQAFTADLAAFVAHMREGK